MQPGLERRNVWTGMRVGLATIAVAVSIFTIETGTASASRLCNAEACSSSAYPANTALSASLAEGTQAVLLSSIGNVTCESSAITGKTTKEAGEPLSVEISELSFGGCKRTEEECTVTTTTLPTSPSFEASGEGNGTLSLEGGEVNFHCGFFINCTYAAPTLQAKGGEPARLGAEELELTKVSGICPETDKLDVTYTVAEPSPVYLVL